MCELHFFDFLFHCQHYVEINLLMQNLGLYLIIKNITSQLESTKSKMAFSGFLNIKYTSTIWKYKVSLFLHHACSDILYLISYQ